MTLTTVHFVATMAPLYVTIDVSLSSSICDQLYINRCWLLYCFLCMFVIILYTYDLCLLQCVHIIRIYIFRGHIKLIDKFVVFGSFLMWIDLDKYKLDRREILFTITKMQILFIIVLYSWYSDFHWPGHIGQFSVQIF